MALQPSDIIDGKYRIVRLLGEGGMGAVYEGENARIHRRVAIKVLHASTAAKSTAVRRFEQEAKAAGLIGSEHIVEVLDLGALPSGEQYMVMEYLEGEDLGARIKKVGRLSPDAAALIVFQLLEGLAAAHRAGIIHRDLKPDNVFLVRSLAGQRDFVKVLDFGVSKFSALDNEEMSMTRTGAVVGTPYYLSPEQARGVRALDARSDLFSVGVLLYQAVTGKLPFHAETFNELVFKIALEPPQPANVIVPDLDPRFAAIIEKAMVRDVNGRFQTASEFQDAISRWMTQRAEPPGFASGRPGSPAVVGSESARLSGAAQASTQSLSGTAALPQLPPAGGSFPGVSGPYAGDMSASHGGAPPGLPANPLTAAASAPTPAPKRNETAIALAITAGAILVLLGGAFGAYKVFTGRGGQPEDTSPSAPSASPQGEAQNTQTTTTPRAEPSQAPAVLPIASGASPSAAPATSTEIQPTAQPQGTSPQRPGNASTTGAAPGGTVKKVEPTSTSAPTSQPKSTGRVIDSDL